jgi:UDP-GlcNAc:undecaprenyl-phosphate/decaprenyl-phosphate GlcNAc-1-phosphate transferase
MTTAQLIAAAAGAVAGAVACGLLIRRRLREFVRPELMRTNVSGRQVPVVLGAPVVWGALAGISVAVLIMRLANETPPWRLSLASWVVLVPLALAGWWDDRRGDELPRGFAGHLGAARKLRLTGGIVKLAAGALAGSAAGAIVAHGLGILEVALAIALAANLINLLDRAPGRAGKVALLVLLPLAFLGAEDWTVSAAGSIGALAAALPPDLKERAMLGDGGANPVGGLLGLGLGVSLPEPWLALAILLLLALNLASERWSFSRAFSRVAILDAFDRVGRR